MKLDSKNRYLIDNRQLDFIGALENQMQKCLEKHIDAKKEDIQNTVYGLASAGYEPYQIITILSLINNL